MGWLQAQEVAAGRGSSFKHAKCRASSQEGIFYREGREGIFFTCIHITVETRVLVNVIDGNPLDMPPCHHSLALFVITNIHWVTSMQAVCQVLAFFYFWSFIGITESINHTLYLVLAFFEFIDLLCKKLIADAITSSNILRKITSSSVTYFRILWINPRLMTVPLLLNLYLKNAFY